MPAGRGGGSACSATRDDALRDGRGEVRWTASGVWGKPYAVSAGAGSVGVVKSVAFSVADTSKHDKPAHTPLAPSSASACTVSFMVVGEDEESDRENMCCSDSTSGGGASVWGRDRDDSDDSWLLLRLLLLLQPFSRELLLRWLEKIRLSDILQLIQMSEWSQAT